MWVGMSVVCAGVVRRGVGGVCLGPWLCPRGQGWLLVGLNKESTTTVFPCAVVSCFFCL